MIIDIDIYEELLKSELKMTASDTEMELNLYYKQSSIVEKLSTVAKETLSKLYKNFNINNKKVELDMTIETDNFLSIDKKLFKDFIKNRWLNNFNNINNDSIKKIITDTVTKQINLDTDNNFISKNIATKMKKSIENTLEIEYNNTINNIKYADNNIERNIKNSFEIWNNAYNNKDLKIMKQQADKISSNIKKYMNLDKDVVHNATYIISKTKYLEGKNNKKKGLEMSDIEEELLKKFVNEELQPEPQMSEELEKIIEKYSHLAEREYSLDEQGIQEMNKLQEKIQAQAKIENIDINTMFGNPDTSELEKILKEIQKGLKKC